ncbi:transcriptional regulator GutM [Intestinibacter sp.]|uniref:transcriptional regulator GutM n=1 Tax=Intestinibacter sp. TaxID=1965304 RepID=UPI002A75B065|nr:transcriptional regulator GutM [Intestinibacter sp.]MDY2737433.1 transcriptional regulator GutM [Intestinibacter sp.]MDY4576332.1 transcriptional regulator GutM [Intestinibacter sp.]
MKIIIVLILLYLANFGTSYYLHKKYVASQRRVRQYGGVSTARTKGGFTKKGKIVLLAFDDEEEIIKYGEKFEGITVFSKFEKIEGIEGLTLDEVENKFADEEVIIQAVQYIREREKDVDSEVDEKSEEEQIDEIVENKAIEANDTTV